MMKVLAEEKGWTKVELSEKEKKRLKKGMEIFWQVLADDEKTERERGPGLPEDWRNRRFKDITIEAIDPKTGEVKPIEHYGLPLGAENRLMGAFT
jgi:hypothetical protein